MKGIIGKKVGMTSVFDEAGNNLPCTVIEAGPCVVTQVKTEDTDGYSALQLSYDEKKEKNTPAPMQGHFSKAKTTPKRQVIEFRDMNVEANLGDTLTISDLFEEGETIKVIGTTKGKGFQGVVKRHGFHGVGGRTHGQKDRERAPGSIGMSSTPSRVLKGMRMAGRDGGNRVKTKNLRILKMYPEKNLVLVSGNVAGHNGSYVIIES